MKDEFRRERGGREEKIFLGFVGFIGIEGIVMLLSIRGGIVEFFFAIKRNIGAITEKEKMGLTSVFFSRYLSEEMLINPG